MYTDGDPCCHVNPPQMCVVTAGLTCALVHPLVNAYSAQRVQSVWAK